MDKNISFKLCEIEKTEQIYIKTWNPILLYSQFGISSSPINKIVLSFIIFTVYKI